MKIGFISDAHGNPVGLSNCLEFFNKNGIDKIYFLGDAVGYLPRWSEVLKLLRDNDVICLRGNHDEMVLNNSHPEEKSDIYRFMPEYVESIDTYLDWMRTWPLSIDAEVAGRKLLLVHGSPSELLTGYIYPWTDLSSLESVDADCIVMGHTHRPFIRHVAGKLVVNIGSCGLPRDVGNLSSCGILDIANFKFEIYRIKFDVEHAIEDAEKLHSSVIKCLGDLVEIKARIHNLLEVWLLYKKIENYNQVLEQTVQERTAELRESESRYRSLTELGSDWYWEQDARGVFTKVSGPVLEMLGMRGDAASRRACNEDIEAWNKAERRILESKISSRQSFQGLAFSRMKSDGSQQRFQVSGAPMFNQTGSFVGYRGIAVALTSKNEQ